MKRICLILVSILSLFFANDVFAGFNFGTDTYSSVGNQLIVNSTGDQTSSSTLGNLGTNDFIGELGVKNDLKLAGYTVAYDANNPTALAQCYSQYNQTLPSNVALTQLQFAGLNGDPRALQNVYVLTSEYDKLSAEGQSNSIDILNSGLSTETTNRIDGDTAETNTRQIADNTLQNNISSETQNRINEDNTLKDNINAVNDHVDNLDNRVGKLEKTQYKLEYGVRVLDTQRMTVVPYISQNFTRGCVDEAGLRVTFKIGKSYEEKLIEKNNVKQKELQEQIYTMKADFAVYKAEHK